MPLFLHVLKKKRGQIQNLQNEIHWRLREMMHLKGFHTTWHIMCSNITARFMYYISVSLLECSPHQIQTRDHFFLSGSFSPLSLSHPRLEEQGRGRFLLALVLKQGRCGRNTLTQGHKSKCSPITAMPNPERTERTRCGWPWRHLGFKGIPKHPW